MLTPELKTKIEALINEATEKVKYFNEIDFQVVASDYNKYIEVLKEVLDGDQHI